jgi:serine/threonine protein kinase/tetratricopeptide (TPR) repeat protein
VGDPSNQAKAIFLAALDEHASEQWPAFLEQACGGDVGLRAEVERLLRARCEMGSFHEVSPAPLATVDESDSTRPSTVIGHYKLLQQLGEGGMGTVFLAEQTQPVQRKVALKIIKPGMDSRQVIARFEAERQALALMDHPHIARVLDAGTADNGRPYFVMELVKGVPITRYCDEHRLTPRQRLELFVPVCQAVQHAHQKGIIHRDLKPSNVLVAPYDGRPVPKVIDFGVAKATGPKLTERTLFTEIGQVVGTLEYMSPEQAELNQLDIDTRSDIYSLGVLLYELLTGTTPLEKKRLKEAAMLELLRLIREEEPPRPSTRLSASKDTLPAISAQRQTEPAKLAKLVRGDLDWIVMKALEKDRNRRYETANGFAMDIQRHLADEPVQACPPSVGYRLRKFARRNKTGLAVAALILVVITVVGAGGGWVIRDRAAREQRLTGQVELIMDDVDRLERAGKWAEAQAAAERAWTAVEGGEADDALRRRVGGVRRDLAFVARLDGIRQEHALHLEGRQNDAGPARDYPLAFRDYGVDVEALPVEEAVARLGGKPALAAPIATALDDWVGARVGLGEGEAAWKPLISVARGLDPDPLRDRLRAMWGRNFNPKEWQEVKTELLRLAESIDLKDESPGVLISLAGVLDRAQLPDAAMRIRRDGQYAHPADFWLNYDLGVKLQLRKDYAGALRYSSIAVSLRPDAAAAHEGLGGTLCYQGKLDEGVAEYRKAIQLDSKSASAHSGLGAALREQRELDEAVAEGRKAIELDPNLSAAHCNLGIALQRQGKPDEAVAEYRKAIELDPKLSPAHNNLGTALSDQGKPDEAVVEYRKAIALDQNYAQPHINLGTVLRDQGKLDEAVVESRKAIELDRNSADAHTNLGTALSDQGKLDEAVAEYRKAIELDRKNALPHGGVAFALSEQGDESGAVAEYRMAIALDPDFAEAHCNLGRALEKQGEIQAALAETRRGHELGSRKPSWKYPSGEWVRRYERLADLDGRLPDILAGKAAPSGPGERIELARLCALKRLNRAAAHFYEEAFAEPGRADDNRYYRPYAARAAAEAGCGQGKDADKLDDKEKARLRAQALDWLRAALGARRSLLEKGPAESRLAAVEEMETWQKDPGLAGVREAEARARLPEAERQAWQKLWDDVAETLAHARAKATPKKNPDAR